MKIKKLAIAAALVVASATSAFAHATSIGFENAGPGSVTIWLGTYSVGHGPSALEGSMNLAGVNGNPFASTTSAFTQAAGDANGAGASWTGITGYMATKPAGLNDGVTNFYGCVSGALQSTCTNSNLPTHWQGVTFSGLGAGDYQFTYIPIANPSAQWAILNPNMNGVFTLDGTVVGAVPLPAAGWLMLAAFGGLGLAKRRKKAA